MNRHYKKLLNELFDTLDIDSSGFLDVRAFQALGEVMTGAPISIPEATVQLKRADKDNDDMVSRIEWLEFSVMLMQLDEDTFTDVISDYISKVKYYFEKKRRLISAH